MLALLWTLIAFSCGALPLSYWLGRVALHTDIRTYGDGNPGASNVFRAGGKGWGTLAMLLDFAKGALPVGLAHYAVGLTGWALVAVALAPVLGHAYSPFLGLHGGKALAVTFGIWCGLTLYVVPLVLGAAFAFWLLALRLASRAVLLGMLTLLVFLAATRSPWEWFAVWAGNLALLLWKQRGDYQRS